MALNDFKVDNLIEFLSLLPKGEFEFNNENDEAVVEFDTLDDIDEFLSYSMEITGDPYGKDKEGVISFYVVYNGEDNHENFKLLVEQFNLNDYFEYEIKLKKIPKKELEKKPPSGSGITILNEGDPKKVKTNEMKLFSKEWWSDVIIEEIINEGISHLVFVHFVCEGRPFIILT